MMLWRWGHVCALPQLVLISETFSIKTPAFKSELINLSKKNPLMATKASWWLLRAISTIIRHRAGEWDSIWEVRACLVSKVFSRHLLLAIARDRIWLELDLYSDLVWLFLRPKMRTVLALHLKINESCTAKKKNWNEKLLLGQKWTWTLQHN